MSTGYLCPQCLSKHCELPVECRSCGLTLVSAPHLARSYHYLFPVATFQEIGFEGNQSSCFGCQKVFTQKDKKVVVFIISIHCCRIVQSWVFHMRHWKPAMKKCAYTCPRPKLHINDTHLSNDIHFSNLSRNL